jgi:outer membrane protein OmpA-like peptidoglycan-associated protein
LLLSLLAGFAAAEEVRLYRANEAVDPHEVARILDRPAAQPAQKTRSIRLLDGGSPVVHTMPVPTPAPSGTRLPAPDALALPVQFKFDSAEILPSAREQLDALAAGIRMLPPQRPVVIEGHTDAAGSDEYNEGLSARRANAVKRYLVAQHGIEADRLRAVGLGEYATLPGRDPHAAENRRVQFRGE